MIGKIFVVLPAYNEEPVLRRLLLDIASALNPLGGIWEAVVVNDGSSDGTVQLVQELSKSLPVRLLSHDKNRGYGAALSTGFGWVLAHGANLDAVVSLDCDRTHPPEYIPAMLRQLEQGCDVVTASYALPGSRVTGVPVVRRLLSAGCNHLFHLFRPVPGVRTYTNGFRVYRVALLKIIKERFGETLIEEPGFPGGLELFLKACAAGARAGEVPFHLRYEQRGASKIRVVRTVAGYLVLLWKSRFIRPA